MRLGEIDEVRRFATNNQNNKKRYKHSRWLRRLAAWPPIHYFKEDLIKQDWKEVYVEDVDEAYDKCISILTTFYDKNGPSVKKMGKQNFAEKPWLTKGIQKSCKQKNALYKLFIKKRTKVAEQVI